MRISVSRDNLWPVIGPAAADPLLGAVDHVGKGHSRVRNKAYSCGRGGGGGVRVGAGAAGVNTPSPYLAGTINTKVIKVGAQGGLKGYG